MTVDSADLKRAVETLGVAPGRVRVISGARIPGCSRPASGRRAAGRSWELATARSSTAPATSPPIYNTDLVLARFQKVLAAHPHAVLLQKHYQRDPEALAGYLKSAQALGVADRVRLIGDKPYTDVPELYALADVVLSVPSSDATPMSVLEAMACGVIPIVSDLPSLRSGSGTGRTATWCPSETGTPWRRASSTC